MRAELEALVEKWRKQAAIFEVTYGDSEVEGAYFSCADELSAILSREKEPRGEFTRFVRHVDEKKPNPRIFPSGGNDSLRFVAYDPERFDVCHGPSCNCRNSRNASRGFGATEAEALADFWEQWEST